MGATDDAIAMGCDGPRRHRGNRKGRDEMKSGDLLGRRNGTPSSKDRGPVTTLLRRSRCVVPQGLCSDCVERFGCNFSTAGRTVWQCEEYRADEE